MIFNYVACILFSPIYIYYYVRGIILYGSLFAIVTERVRIPCIVCKLHHLSKYAMTFEVPFTFHNLYECALREQIVFKANLFIFSYYLFVYI